MTLSKRDLYAAGLPLGDSATRRRPDGRIICGGGGESSSSNETKNIDKRLVVDSGLGISADNSNMTVTVTDGGLVSRGLDSLDRNTAHAFDVVKSNNAIQGQGFTQLLGAAEQLFNRGQALIGQTQQHVADAYSQATTDKAGTIDNRTITVLAVAGAVALFALKK